MVCVMPVKKLSICVSLFALCCLSISWAKLANAHPHMWVDLKSRIVLHDDANPSAISQEWLFDDFFSTALIEEAGLHPDGLEAGLQQEITEIMKNLQPYDYFTLVKRNGEPVPLTWIGTCLNPADGVHYIISYNDCCGKTSCGRCLCNRNEKVSG